MAIFKREGSPFLHTRFTECGIRVRESTGTASIKEAKRYEEKRRSDIREQVLYGNGPKKTWKEAKCRWLKEMSHKRTILSDVEKFEFLAPYLEDMYLDDINSDLIFTIVSEKEETGAKPATVNRMLALIKSILNKSLKEWKWVEKIPYIKLKPENNERHRWLTKSQAIALLVELPPHLVMMVEFSLATGQRADNVCSLRWEDIDMERRIWVIDSEDFKNGEEHSVPLNKSAMNVLYLCRGQHKEYVFSYKGRRIKSANTKAFRLALSRAGIKNFRWHDLRHTWASWHVQNGTTLQELQKLGGWKNYDMVLRYSHLNQTQLMEAADNITEVI